MKLSVDKLLQLLPGFKLDARGKNLKGPCPNCGHSEFGISIDEGHQFGCYRKKNCGFSGNIFTLLKFLGKLDEVQSELVTQLPEKIVIGNEQQHQDIQELPDITYPIGWKRIYDNEYLNSRGFTQLQYQLYPVGISNLDAKVRKDYVIFGVYLNKQLKGWVARNVKSKHEIDSINIVRKQNHQKQILRYINSLNDFGKLCYGIDDVTPQTETLMIVEGIFDKINVDKLLSLHTESQIKCVSVFKATISHEQVKLIKQKGPNIKTIIVLLDSDVLKSVKQTISILSGYQYEVLVGYNEYKDCGDMNEEELLNVLDNLQSGVQFKGFMLDVQKL